MLKNIKNYFFSFLGLGVQIFKILSTKFEYFI